MIRSCSPHSSRVGAWIRRSRFSIRVLPSGQKIRAAASFARTCSIGHSIELTPSGGAFSAVHQFTRVGEHAFIGGATIATQDVLPFMKTVGSRNAKTYGVNTIGLQRKGFSTETIESIQRAYRLLVRSKLPLQDALTRIENELAFVPEARYLVEFIRTSKRGFIR